MPAAASQQSASAPRCRIDRCAARPWPSSPARVPCAAKPSSPAARRVHLNNFKSYGGQQTLGPFGDFQAVIGPNGAGEWPRALLLPPAPPAPASARRPKSTSFVPLTGMPRCESSAFNSLTVRSLSVLEARLEVATATMRDVRKGRVRIAGLVAASKA